MRTKNGPDYGLKCVAPGTAGLACNSDCTVDSVELKPRQARTMTAQTLRKMEGKRRRPALQGVCLKC